MENQQHILEITKAKYNLKDAILREKQSLNKDIQSNLDNWEWIISQNIINAIMLHKMDCRRLWLPAWILNDKF